MITYAYTKSATITIDPRISAFGREAECYSTSNRACVDLTPKRDMTGVQPATVMGYSMEYSIGKLVLAGYDLEEAKCLAKVAQQTPFRVCVERRNGQQVVELRLNTLGDPDNATAFFEEVNSAIGTRAEQNSVTSA